MKKIELYLAISNNGDGSASAMWFLTKKRAQKFLDYQEENQEGFGDAQVDIVETFEGSNIHREAISTQKMMDEDEEMDRKEQENED